MSHLDLSQWPPEQTEEISSQMSTTTIPGTAQITAQDAPHTLPEEADTPASAALPEGTRRCPKPPQARHSPGMPVRGG